MTKPIKKGPSADGNDAVGERRRNSEATTVGKRRHPGILRKGRSGEDSEQIPERVTWDEKVIAEHDKERGTRMRIEEPPTPYYAAADIAGLATQSMEAIPAGDTRPSDTLPPPPPASPDPGDLAAQLKAALEAEAAKQQKESDFKAKRKAHYDEFIKQQELRAKLPAGEQIEEDDDDDEDDADDNAGQQAEKKADDE